MTPCAPHRVYGDCGICLLWQAVAALRAPLGKVAR
jgi:hypothetical protein